MHFGKKSLQPHKTTKQTLRLELWDMVSHSSNLSSEAKSWKVSPVGSWASASGNGFSTVSSLGGNMPIRAPKWCDPNCSPSFLACFCSFELLVVEAVLRLQMDVMSSSRRFVADLGLTPFASSSFHIFSAAACSSSASSWENPSWIVSARSARSSA